MKTKIISTSGVLHAADGSIVRRGVTATRENRPEGAVYVIDCNAFPISEVRKLEHPTRFALPDGSYLMP